MSDQTMPPQDPPSKAHNETEALAALIRQFAPEHRLKAHRPLTGGVSSTMRLLELSGPQNTPQKVVLRLHGPEALEQNPDSMLNEFRLLNALTQSGIPAPAALHLDQTGEILSGPALVLEWIDGTTDPHPLPESEVLWYMARHLTKIHEIVPSHYDLKFLPLEADRTRDQIKASPQALDQSLEEKRIREGLSALGPINGLNDSRLLHGDFWPGNLLWKDGGLIAIIDWEDAATGDPLEDLGNTRMEVLWAFGYDAMEAFTESYLSNSAIDARNLPIYDLLAALRPVGKMSDWGLPPLQEQAMRNGHKLFVNQAMRELDL